MASWLFGISKLKTNEVIQTKEILSVPTATQEHMNKLPTIPHLPYDLQASKSKTSDENKSPTSMLDSIPFVLSNQINMNTDSYSYSIEDTRKYLLSVKKKIMESDELDYDFSNDRRLVKNATMHST